MADKFLQLGSNGRPKEIEALDTSSGAADAGKIPALNASGLIDPTMLPDAVTFSVPASENLSAGNLINLWNDTGTLKMRKADNTSTAKRADGFIESSVTSGNSGSPVLGSGVLSGLTSLTLGAEYFLGTNGGITTTPPTGIDTIVQSVGRAKSATELIFFSGDVYERSST